MRPNRTFSLFSFFLNICLLFGHNSLEVFSIVQKNLTSYLLLNQQFSFDIYVFPHWQNNDLGIFFFNNMFDNIKNLHWALIKFNYKIESILTVLFSELNNRQLACQFHLTYFWETSDIKLISYTKLHEWCPFDNLIP